MQSKVYLFVMIQQRLPGFRWDGPAENMTIRYGPNSDVYLLKEKYFGNKEFLLGDLAFSASSVMVPAFKKSPNANLSETRTYFNTKLA